jgi:ABC-type molybdate transport system substrate-binding protein
MPPPKLLKILSGGAMRPLLRELMPRFEREHGITAAVEFQLSAALKRAPGRRHIRHRGFAAA